MICKILFSSNSAIFWKNLAEEGETGNSKAFLLYKQKRLQMKKSSNGSLQMKLQICNMLQNITIARNLTIVVATNTRFVFTSVKFVTS